MRAAAGALGLVPMLLVACASLGPPATPTHAEGHDPLADRVRTALEAELGMTFEPAGPHHQLGTAPNGVELDLVGVPVEQVVLSLPVDHPEAGLAYLPHLRDLLGGQDPAYDWIAAMLACRRDPSRTCDTRFEHGDLRAEFTSEGPEFVVVSVARDAAG